MNDFLGQMAHGIAVGTADPLAQLALDEFSPLVVLVMAGLLMALVMLLPSVLEAVARSSRAIQRKFATGVSRIHGPWPARAGVGRFDFRRHWTHRTK
jgi:hypothetical protein